MVEVQERESAQAEAVRTEVRDFLAKNWKEGMDLLEWRNLLADTGWGCPTWPSDCHGRGFDRDPARIVSEEFARVGAAGPAGGLALMLAGPTIIAHGNEAQKQRYLRPIITGEEPWCQLFSEPSAGSDLAGLQTKAERHGDEWIVNGQKVWTSGAQGAKFGMLVARTDWDAPKHQGITYFAFDMKQPGVEVRPLKQMNGMASFNEVFFTDARVPHENVIGEVNGGWPVAVTTLANERVGLGGGGVSVGGMFGAGGRSGAQQRRRGRGADGEAHADQQAQMQQQFRRRMGVQGLIEIAKRRGTWSDPVVRQQVAQLHLYQEAARLNALRSRAAAQRGVRPGPEGSLGKLSASRISRTSANLMVNLLGAGGMLTGGDAPMNGAAAASVLSYHSSSIAGGTDEVQRNIVGERVLGLPKDIQVDREIPFKDVKKSAATTR